MRAPCRDAYASSRRCSMRGMARRKAQNPYGSCLAARGRLRGAPITAFPATGPAFVRSARANAPTDPSASSWQGLLVAPEGAPMPPECLVATRPAGAAPRPASRRLMKRPLDGRGGCIISEVRETVIMRGQLTQSRHPGESRDPGATRTEPAALDTGFRRYDGACCLVGFAGMKDCRESVELSG